MKNIFNISIILLISIFFYACTENPVDQPGTSGKIIMLHRIINDIAGDPGKGKTFLELDYEGTHVRRVVGYIYREPYKTPYSQTDLFYYDNAGLLSEVETSYIVPQEVPYKWFNYGITRTVIKYSGKNISEIISYMGTSVFRTYVFTYQNDKLTNIKLTTSQATYNDAYVSDAAGNTYESTGSVTFDSNKSIVSTLPHWQYFHTQQLLNTLTSPTNSLGFINGIFYLFPAVNNLLSRKLDGNYGIANYSYEYGANSLPTSSAVTYNGKTQSFKYEYIEVK